MTPSHRFTVLLLAAVFLLSLALAARAEAFVYWTEYDLDQPEAGTIGRANLDASGVDRSFIAGVDAPNDVAVDAAHVYWVNNFFPGSTIGRANLDGTGVDKSFINVGASAVAVDAGHIYWGSRDGIGRANLDGTGVDQSFISGADFFPPAVAVDAAHIYWVDQGAGTIGRANLDGTGVDQSFIVAPQASYGVAVDAAHIYWGDSNNDTIGRANLDGTGIDWRFITWPDAGGVAVDAARVYWTEGRGTIGRASLEGAGVDRRFITGLDYAEGVAVDPLRSFSFGKVKQSEKKGTAKLTVKVPGPGELELANSTEVKGAKKRAEAKGKEKLPVRAKGKTKKTLKRKGKAKVKAEVTYSPEGGNPNMVANTLTKTVKLSKRR
jgi:virginiamycin B lyase